MLRLGYKEIKERMIEWRNLKKLHTVARERIKVLEQLAKVQSEKIDTQEKLISHQGKMIENLELQIEELRRIIFGKRRKKDKSEDSNNNDDPDNQPRLPAQRPPESYQRPLPKESEITKEEFHTLDSCPTCQGGLNHKTISTFYEEDIPLPILKEVTKHTVEKGYCSDCKKSVSSLTLPPASVILGKQTRIFVCYLSLILNLSFEKIRQLLLDTYQLKISDGEISNILEKEAVQLRPEYERLHEKIKSNYAGAPRP